jgi:transaldolase
MNSGYFHRVTNSTPTRVWVNNPAGSEIQKAIEAGAESSTTNPSYCSKVIVKEPDYLCHLIDRAVEETEDNNIAAEQVYQTAAKRVVDAFLPLYERSAGAFGFVTMQGDPRLDKNPDAIVREALRFREMGPNVMAKIPVTRAGIRALEILVGEDLPLCATEIFSVSQAVQMGQVYKFAAARTGKHPPFYVTHITGIFDQLFQETARNEDLGIPPAILQQAGCIIARKEYRVMRQKGLPGTLLGGGARGLLHFTEMVGGDLAVTLNWSTMDDLIREDGPVVPRFDADAHESDIELLCKRLPNFRRAFEEAALHDEEYEDFGPVVLFRTQFLNGYTRILDAVADRRLMRKVLQSPRIFGETES